MSSIAGFTIYRGLSPNDFTRAHNAESRALSYFPHFERTTLDIDGSTVHIWGHSAIRDCVHLMADGSTLILIGSPHNKVSWKSVEDKLIDAGPGLDFDLPWEGRVILLRVDKTGTSWTLWNDWLGSIPVYHFDLPAGRVASTLEPVAVAAGNFTSNDFFLPGLVSLLVNGHFISDWTLYKNLHLLLPDRVTIWDDKGFRSRQLWTVLASQDRWEVRWDDLVDEMHVLSHQAIADPLKAHTSWVLPLSAGLDSRLIAGVAADMGTQMQTYAWGSSQTTDVIYSRKIAKTLRFPWKHVKLPKDFLNNYTHQWFDVFGTSMHFQGMYLMSFLHEIQASPSTPILTGFIGDALAGDALNHFLILHSLKSYQVSNEWYSDWDPIRLRSAAVRPLDDALEANAAMLSAQIESYPGAKFQKLMYLDLWSRQRTFISFLSTLKDYWCGVATPFLNRPYARFCLSLPLAALDHRRLLGDVFRRYYGKLAVIPGTYAEEPYILTGQYLLRKRLSKVFFRLLGRQVIQGMGKVQICVDFEPMQAYGRESLWPLFEAQDQLSEWLDVKQVEQDFQDVMTSTSDFRPLRRLQAAQTFASRLLPVTENH